MIKGEIVKVKISNKTVRYYNTIISDSKIGDIIEISSILLPKNSHKEIIGICDYCGTERVITMKAYNAQTGSGEKKFTCSKKNCSLKKSKETNLKNWGVQNPFQSEIIKEKIKEKNIKNWGVENPQKSEVIKSKSKITNLKKWGFIKPSMSDSIKSKTKERNNIKFGVDYASQSPHIKNKIELSCYDKYGVGNFSKTDRFKEIIKDKSFNRMLKKIEKHGVLLVSDKGEYKIKCSACGEIFKILHTLMYKRITGDKILCTECNPKNQNIKEGEIFDFINSNYSGLIIRNDRNLISKEIDIYLPELGLAFEFNGLYWHSELYRDRKYHLEKTNACLKNRVSLFHIWEDDWEYKTDIVSSIILNKLGKSRRIWARKTIIREIDDNGIIRDFLNKNHIQGFVGSSIKLGLFYNDDLVSIMTFGKLRRSLGQKSKGGSYELLRFCNILNTSVVGGASKLLKYFIINYKPFEIISYSDNSRSSGDMYKKLGFKLLSETPPNYYWVVDGIRKHRFNYRKDKLISTGYDPNKTEVEIMNGLGYYRIFDSGSKKWII